MNPGIDEKDMRNVTLHSRENTPWMFFSILHD
jgi:hypothetical protein